MPDATMESLLRWSQEFDFSADSIRKNAPQTAGVYEILQSQEYSRYGGTTRVLKIGMSESSVRAELLNHLGRHTAANRLTRIRLQPDISVSFKYITLEPGGARVEQRLLRDFEEDHWDCPVLSSQRGFKRGEDRHFRSK